MLTITNQLIDNLLEQAASTPRLRKHYDLRNAAREDSQRMLNALLPGTPLPIHRHNDTDETIIILKGRMDEVFYNAKGEEVSRVHLDASKGQYGVQIPASQYHSVEVFEPSVIVEFKAGRYDPETTEDYL
ncbi:MAG: cupin fold metalloprotein, WbuC family [Rikenellaceae bacterium]|jgi:cupin fold WbuC family metalloprotein|nr:cupin fold metalloprotein, WbuC family [Rikenellaceae bacterium]